MAVNSIYNNYSNDYSSLFSSIGSTNSSSSTDQLTQLLYKVNDYSTGYNNYSNKYVTSDVQNYLSDIKMESENLKTSLSSLLGKTKSKTSSFDEKTVVSSNTDALSVSTSSSYKNSFSDTNVTVKQVASGQVNEGSKLSATGKALSTGWKQFEIEVDGKKTQVSFQVTSTDNNESIQKKMAEAINAKNIGVKASVSYDSTNKTSQLKLESTNTGDDVKNKFTVRDVTNGGNAVSAMGIGTATQNAQNAIYKINDGDYVTSKSNKVDLGNGVTATLKKASDTPVKVSLGTESKSSINKVRDMVNAFNGLLATAEDNKNDRSAARLLNQLKGLSTSYSASLERIGISVSSDGYLSIDSDKMEKAAENGNLEKFFKQNGDTNYGFANRLNSVAESVSKNPVEYVSSTQLKASSTAGNSQSLNYMQTYRYNQIINSGLLFDYMF